jgi:hypothetical protein
MIAAALSKKDGASCRSSGLRGQVRTKVWILKVADAILDRTPWPIVDVDVNLFYSTIALPWLGT